MGRHKSHRHELVQKRFFITPTTNLILNIMNELMPMQTKDEFVEAALLYGMAYINQQNKLKMSAWVDKLQLPRMEDVEELLAARAGRVDND